MTHSALVVILRGFLASTAVLALAGPAISADLVVTGPVTISVPTTYDNVTVQSGGILTVDGALTVINDMTIQSGGVVTHSLRLEDGLKLDVTGTLHLQAGGLIDLNAKGLKGGHNGSIFGDIGETYNVSNVIVAGATTSSYTGAGASFGGTGASGSSGGVTNAAYGLLEDARHLGSGGAGTSLSGGSKGGHGGGRATINAGAFIVDGTLRANGGTAVGTAYPGGGGSGGSVRLDVISLSGSGFIQAVGGNGAAYISTGGAGGGGRVAIDYDTNTFPLGNVSVRGGNAGVLASAGTIYLKDNAAPSGDLVCDNNSVASTLSTPLRTELANFHNFTIRNQGRLSVSSSNVAAFEIGLPVTLLGPSALTLGSGVSMTISNTSGFDLDVQGGSSVVLNAGSMLLADRVRINGTGSTMTTDTSLDFPNPTDLELSGTATLNVQSNATLSLGVFDTTNIQSGTLSLGAGARLVVSSGGIVVGAGVTLVKDGYFGSLGDQIGDMTIQSGGVVTHSLRLEDGLKLDVTGTLHLQAGGLIDLNAKGLKGGHNGSIFGDIGETYNVSNVIVAGATTSSYTGAGASFGGTGASGSSGGVTNAAYGLLEDARHLGSGGAGTSLSGGSKGGHGGGRATINAGAFIVDGTLRANGGTAVGTAYPGGGGSGGSVRLDVISLSGSGFIQAVGGNGAAYISTGGAGGGGRVAIDYDTNTFPLGNVSVRGGNAGVLASAGTIYLKDNAAPSGDLVCDNNSVASTLSTPLRTELANFHNFTIRNQGRLSVSSSNVAAFEIGLPVTLLGPSALTLGSGVSMTISNTSGFDLDVQGGSSVVLNAGSMLLADRVRINGTGSTMTTDTSLDFPNPTDLELSGTATLNVQSNATLSLGVFDTTNIQSGTLSLGAGARLVVSSGGIVVGAGVTLVKDGYFGSLGDQIGDMTIQSGGVVTHTRATYPGLVLQISNECVVASGGSINVTGRGLQGGRTEGNPDGFGLTYLPDGSVGIGATFDAQGGAGGSHGGVGGMSTGGGTPSTPYGSAWEPIQFGSGGASPSLRTPPPGGDGGGAIRLTATTLRLEGSILADGSAGGQVSGETSGGGSGGSILIEVGELVGPGWITANGGSALCGAVCSGSGGGGRIATRAVIFNLNQNNITADGGAGLQRGRDGTVSLMYPGQAWITPFNIADTGTFILNIRGLDLDQYTAAELEGSVLGYDPPRIDAANVTSMPDGGGLFATFELVNAPHLFYTITLRNENEELRLHQPISVSETEEAKLSVQYILPPVLRANRRTNILARVANTGNVGLDGYAVRFGDFELSDQPSLIAPLLEAPEPDTPQFEYYPFGPGPDSLSVALELFGGRLAPQQQFFVQIAITPSLPDTSRLALLGLDKSNCPPGTQKICYKEIDKLCIASPLVDCLTSTASSIANFIVPFLPSPYNEIGRVTTCVLNGVYLLADLLRLRCEAAGSDIYVRLEAGAGFLAEMVRHIVNCLMQWAPGFNEGYIAQAVWRGVGNYGSLMGVVKCWKMEERWDELYDCHCEPVGGSQDPNEMVGPAGHDGYLRKEEPLVYVAMFENLPTATLPAQVVEVRIPLDTAVLDSLDLTPLQVVLADSTYPLYPLGDGQAGALIDLRPVQDSLVLCIAKVQDDGATLVFTLQGRDPATGLPFEDPSRGFLPPNVNGPEGEGSVFFSTRPSDNVGHGTVISMSAAIIFDENPVIMTNVWQNTIDDMAPTAALFASAQTDSTIALGVLASDDGSGLAGVDIYLAINGETYAQIGTVAQDSVLVYRAQTPGLHQFYARAFDYVGLYEEAPAGPDVEVSFSESVPTLVSSVDVVQSDGLVTISWRPSDADQIDLFEVERAGHDRVFEAMPRSGIACNRSGACALVDSTTEPGQSYFYRLAYGKDRLWTSAAYRIDIAAIQFAFTGIAPNPTASATVLEFRAMSDEVLRMEIYDIRGRRLVSQVIPPAKRGNGSFVWDLVGDRGVRVSSGVYFVRLNTARESSVRKVMVLR